MSDKTAATGTTSSSHGSTPVPDERSKAILDAVLAVFPGRDTRLRGIAEAFGHDPEDISFAAQLVIAGKAGRQLGKTIERRQVESLVERQNQFILFLEARDSIDPHARRTLRQILLGNLEDIQLPARGDPLEHYEKQECINGVLSKFLGSVDQVYQSASDSYLESYTNTSPNPIEPRHRTAMRRLRDIAAMWLESHRDIRDTLRSCGLISPLLLLVLGALGEFRGPDKCTPETGVASECDTSDSISALTTPLETDDLGGDRVFLARNTVPSPLTGECRNT